MLDDKNEVLEVKMNTPTLQTDRLILRPFRQEDALDVFECWESDPDVAKYMFWTSHNDIEKTKEQLSFIMKRKLSVGKSAITLEKILGQGIYN